MLPVTQLQMLQTGKKKGTNDVAGAWYNMFPQSAEFNESNSN